jgi:AraC-like DNA-binding protein
MLYQTYPASPNLNSLLKCFWTLEVPAEYSAEKQRIVPDGCMELIFMLGEDIKRFTSDNDFVIQPRAFVVGQLTEPFVIQPTGEVNCFAARFYPYGIGNILNTPLKNLENKETPIAELFGEETAKSLQEKIVNATDTAARIAIIEEFLQNKLNESATIDTIVKSTVEALLQSSGTASIKTILEDKQAQRRQLERKFSAQIGMSPKQLAKILRLQTALKLLLTQPNNSFTQIAYESEYYDQNHFIKDFKEFTGITPKEFLGDGQMQLTSIFYTQD